MPLLTPDQILKLDQGECVFINPAYKGGQEASIPLRLRVKIAQQDVQIQNHSAELWHSKVCDRLTQQMSQQHTITDLDQENEIRREMAERLFPLPVDENNSGSGQDQNVNADISEDEYDDMFRLQEDYL
jgi:hypothetical protein